MDLLAIVNGPRQVTRRNAWIKKAMKPGWPNESHIFEHFLYTDDPFTISIEPEGLAHTRTCAVCANQVTSSSRANARAGSGGRSPASTRPPSSGRIGIMFSTASVTLICTLISATMTSSGVLLRGAAASPAVM